MVIYFSYSIQHSKENKKFENPDVKLMDDTNGYNKLKEKNDENDEAV